MQLVGIDLVAEIGEKLLDGTEAGIEKSWIKKPKGVIPGGTEYLAAWYIAEG